MRIWSPDNLLSHWFPRAADPGRETVMIRALPPSTELDVSVEYEVTNYRGAASGTRVTTLAPPQGTALRFGPGISSGSGQIWNTR